MADRRPRIPIGLGFGSVSGSIDAVDLRAVATLIKEFGVACTQALGEAIFDEATAIIDDAKENYVPFETGGLKESGRVSALTIEDNNAWVEFGFGGPGMPRAVAIHENPSKYDPPTWRGKTVTWHQGGGSKYLERPTLAAVPGMGARLVKSARKYMGL